MTRLGQAFDASEHDDLGDFTPIPIGEYSAQVRESDVCKTKDKQGQYIKLVFEVLDGEFKGKRIWNNYNIVNKSTAAVEIANKGIATLCRAVGIPGVKDTQELHGIPFILKVGIKKADGDYPASNKVTGYAPLKATVKNPKGDPAKTKKEVVADNPNWG